jgi:hypothetical protein
LLLQYSATEKNRHKGLDADEKLIIKLGAAVVNKYGNFPNVLQDCR